MNSTPFTTAPAKHTTLDSLVADVSCQIVEYLGFSKAASALAATSSTWLEYVRFSPAYYERLRSKYPFRFRMASQKHDGVDPRDVDWRQHLIEARREKFGQITNTEVKSGGNGVKNKISEFFTNIFTSPQNRIFGRVKKESRILLVGLDAAGKSTILYKLQLGDVVTTIPTIGFNVETVEYKNVEINSWDVGGSTRLRHLWQHYYPKTDAVIFVVDSNDRDRLSDDGKNHCRGGADEELQRMVAEDELKDAAFLVLANKHDLPTSVSVEEVVMRLQIDKLGIRNWCVKGCSATTGEGLFEGMEWLSRVLNGD